LRADAILVGAIGPYTAPLASMIWALFRRRDLVVRTAVLLADDRGEEYLYEELLGRGRIAEQLKVALGNEVLSGGIELHKPRLANGTVVEDDIDPEHARVISAALAQAVRRAIELAGDRPVVFALIGGSRRSDTARTAALFQRMARPQDLLFDVRVGDARIDGSTRFYFPEQAQQKVQRGAATILASNVQVHLIDLMIERGEETAPKLAIDLLRGEAVIDGAALSLSAAELAWYAYLARERHRGGDGWVIAGADGHADFRAFLLTLRGAAWFDEIKTRPVRELIETGSVLDEELRNMRGKTVQKLKRFAEEKHPAYAHVLVPEADGGRQRIALSADRITLG
jgi:CRISPR-associated protein (TIGR02584 family)